MSRFAVTIRFSSRGCRGRGFTFIEVLATLMILSIVLPVIMQGISVSLTAGALAKNESIAAALGHDKLMEMTAQWQGQLAEVAGEFTPDQTGQMDIDPKARTAFRWQANLSDYDSNLQLLEITVSWQQRQNQQRSLTVSTLVSSTNGQSGDGTSGGIMGGLP